MSITLALTFDRFYAVMSPMDYAARSYQYIVTLISVAYGAPMVFVGWLIKNAAVGYPSDYRVSKVKKQQQTR